jgi:polyhydroxybutyrate depolymerase
MRRASSIAVIALAMATGSCSNPGLMRDKAQWTPGTATHSILVAGDERAFRVHVPPARVRNRLGRSQSYPLVIVLHGSGADGESAERQSAMDVVADSSGWVVAYPDAVSGPFGFGSNWNAGTCCGIATRDSVDDIRFLVAMIDQVSSKLPINVNRVYVAGFSAGARMAYHLACRAAGRVAAAAILSGSVRDAGCRPSRPVPLIVFHGTSDDDVSYMEAADTPPRTAPPATAATLPPSVQLWATLNGCRGLTQVKAAADVTRTTFTGCNADVVMYTVAGGGHGWPGEPNGAGAAPPLSEIAATRLIGQFFAQHVRR